VKEIFEEVGNTFECYVTANYDVSENKQINAYAIRVFSNDDANSTRCNGM